MKYILILSLIFVGCARHHEKLSHHHHPDTTKESEVMFNKLCSESLAEGDVHIAGNDEYWTQHGGKIFYFSSIEKKRKFDKNLPENIKKAQSNFERIK